jgi:hypothetical protein
VELPPPPQVGQYAELVLEVLPARAELVEPLVATRCPCCADWSSVPVERALKNDSEEIALIVASYFFY